MKDVVFADDDGNVVLLGAEAALDAPPASGEADPPAGGDNPPSPSGDPADQPPQEPPPSTSVKPVEVDWDEWHRRQNAVRSAAREFDPMAEGDLREFLQGRTSRDLSDDEVTQFQHDVEVQRVADIADILDEQMRSTTERMRRARRTVRVQAPRGWMTRAFNRLSEAQVEQVAARLLQRGHDEATVKERVFRRVKDEETRTRLEDKLASGEIKVQFAAGPTTVIASDKQMSPEAITAFAVEMARTVAQNIRVPDVNIEIPITMAGGKKTVRRDDKGLISEVVDE
jgi:hypothetical protein